MITYVLDTNAILDTLLDRPQTTKAQEVLITAQNKTCIAYIPLVVFFELAWVLQSFYKKDKSYIVNLLITLASHENIQTEDKTVFSTAIKIFSEHPTFNISDAYIVAAALTLKSAIFISGDKKLTRLYRDLSQG